MVKRIAVIGAGSAGLACIKECLSIGLEPICFERTDDVGGLWKYTDAEENRRGNVMQHTSANNTKDIYCYSDFPPPSHFPNYLSHDKMFQYLSMYAKHFDLYQHINFNTDVVNITKSCDFCESGRWDVVVRKDGEEKTTTYTVDGVMCATGYNCKRNIPDFPGISNFKGTIMHSKEYRSRKGFEGKNVLVIGIGNSAADVVTDLAKCANRVHLSTSAGAWIATSSGVKGLPFEFYLVTRYWKMLERVLSKDKISSMAEKDRGVFNLKEYGLQPNHRHGERCRTMSDELASFLKKGLINVHPNVKCVHPHQIEFEDGSKIQDVDTIIYATGFKSDYSFIDQEAFDWRTDALYKRVFPLCLPKPTFAFIGNISVVGPFIPVTEMQARWVTMVFQNEVALPSLNIMEKEVKNTPKGHRGKSFFDYLRYMDDIAGIIGCKPPIGKALFKDVSLFKEVFFGRCLPAQFRLQGPKPWSGARDFLVNSEKRWHAAAQLNNQVKSC